MIGALYQTVRNRAVAQSSRFFVASVAATAISAAASLYLVRTLPLEIYGALGVILAYAMFAHTLFECRIWEYLVKYLGLFSGDPVLFGNALRLGLLLQVGVGMAATLFCLAAAVPAATWLFKRPDLVPGFLWGALYVALYCQRDLPQALFRIQNRFDVISRLLLLESGVKAVLIVCLARYGLVALVLAHVLTQAVTLAASVAAGLRLLDHTGHADSWRRPLTADFRRQYPEIKRMLLSSYLSTTLKNLSGQADKLLLGSLVSLESVALYKVAGLFTTPLGILGTSAGQYVYAPVSKQTRTQDPAGALPYARSATVRILVAGIVFAAAILVAFSLAVRVGLLLPAYARGLPILAVILATQLVGLGLLWVRPLLFKLGHYRAVVLATLVYSIAFFSGALALIPIWQALGVAVAGFVASIASQTYLVIQANRIRRRPASIPAREVA